MTATGIAIAGLLVITAAWTHYLWLIPQERVPKQPVGWGLAMASGALAQVGGILAFGFEPGAIALAVFGGGFAGFFFWLLAQRHTPAGALTVEVGDPMPPFQALDEGGAEVMSHEWQGRRVLFKLFRGHW